jgi:hypothetical protein
LVVSVALVGTFDEDTVVVVDADVVVVVPAACDVNVVAFNAWS